MLTGILIGKFLPFHKGHEYMINFARAYCDKLTIYVGTQTNEPIPGSIRAEWIRKTFPDCRVLWVNDDSLPQEPSPDCPNFQQIWIDEIKRATQDYSEFNFLFASEDYGQWLAKGIGAQFIPVDPAREAVPISGTDLRKEIYENWSYLPDVVRPYFVKKVCVFGPESTGKTSLVHRLALDYDTVFVPEYGRTYTEMFGTELNYTDMLNIVNGHHASTKALESKANRVLFCDTDPIMSLVWCDMFNISRVRIPIEKPCDLYLLMDIDLPWVDDGTRYFQDMERRTKFFNLCKEELEKRGLPYEVVSGFGPQRTINAFEHVVNHLGF